MLVRVAFFSTLLSVFVLGFFLPRWMGPQNCINSSLVEEITMDGVVVPQCTLWGRSFGPQGLPSTLRANRVLERVEWLENLRPLWAAPDQKIKLEVTSDPKSSVSITESSVQIPVTELSTGDFLDRALIGAWVGLNDPINNQAVTDFLWSILRKDLVLERRVHGETTWAHSLVTLPSYCHRGLDILAHREYCILQNQLRDGLIVDDPQIVPWSFYRPLADVMASVFLRLSVGEKAEFLKKLVFLNSLEDGQSWVEVAHRRSLHEMDLEFWNHLEYVLAPLGLERDLLWSSAKNLMVTKSRQPLRYFLFSSGVEVPSPGPTLPAYGRSARIVVEKGSSKFLYPSDVPLRFPRIELLENSTDVQITLVGCQAPSPTRLLEFETYARRVTFVHLCQPPAALVGELLEKGEERFLAMRKNVEFIEFNLASLRLATKTQGAPKSTAKLDDWRRWLEWKGVEFDKTKEVYRPKAAIDGVNSFRTIN
jgi:hypothetical protein